jgi:hypothetical protein
MIPTDEMNEAETTVLCKSCGLCCTGHLFSWVRLNAPELDTAQSLGLHVIRNDPRQRGFTQPCPLWQGTCTVYTSPYYPRGCRNYQCVQFKELSAGNTSLPNALTTVEQAREMIRDLEAYLPKSKTISFRDRLIETMEDSKNTDVTFRQKANALLEIFEESFGVRDFFDDPEEG